MVVLDASLAGESGAEDSFGRGVTAVGDRDAIVGVSQMNFNPQLRFAGTDCCCRWCWCWIAEEEVVVGKSRNALAAGGGSRDLTSTTPPKASPAEPLPVLGLLSLLRLLAGFFSSLSHSLVLVFFLTFFIILARGTLSALFSLNCV